MPQVVNQYFQLLHQPAAVEQDIQIVVLLVHKQEAPEEVQLRVLQVQQEQVIHLLYLLHKEIMAVQFQAQETM